jgi:NADH:ubiquinone oxidoreductase subunit 6 (subunit J)
MTTSEVYWLTRLDGIHDFLTVTAFILLVGVPVLALFTYMMADLNMDDNEDEQKATAAKIAKRGALLLAAAALLSCFVPTTKELIAIYGISYLTQNKDAREIPAEALKVLNQKLKEMESE